MTVANGNVAMAFTVTFAAGSATMVGAAVVFFPKLVKLASRRLLAGSLGFSSGVMIYISFADIFPKAIDAFIASGMEENSSYNYATLYLFIGILIMKIVEVIVHRLSGDHHHNRREINEDIQITWNENEGQCEMKETPEEEFIVPHCIGCSEDPVGDLKKWQENAQAEVDDMTRGLSSIDTTTNHGSFITNGSTVIDDEETPASLIEENKIKYTQAPTVEKTHNIGVVRIGKITPLDEDKLTVAKEEILFRAPANSRLSLTEEKKKLVRMGITTASAIAIHNFPEGLATFVAALHDPVSGIVLAIAVGAHNIPEGLCVSLPIYYATGNRWKGFLWGVISGMAEPVAAIMGWLVLANAIDDQIYGILFAMVSGMMIMITWKELLPTAHRYDPEDTVVTYCGVGGMLLMALSLVLFKVS